MLYNKYKVLKINDIYKLELGKFMYLNHAKALPEISETCFCHLIRFTFTTTTQEVNQVKITFLILYELMMGNLLLNLVKFNYRINCLQPVM